MNKKLLVLAVSSALTGTSALADTVNVNVYGKLYPQYQTSSSSGATATGTTGLSSLVTANGTNVLSRQAVESTNSYVGFKGDADVGRGMKGWFQVEQSVELDVGTGTFASRNSAAGLSGAFGNIFLGRWDTVYKQLGDPVSFLGVSSGNFVSTSGILSKQGFGTSSSGSFHLRRNNILEYDTPSFGGFQVLAMYSPDEAKTVDRNAYIDSWGLKWESGPLYFAFAHEDHNDLFGGSNNVPAALRNNANLNAHSKDTANRFSFKISLPSHTEIGLDISQIQYKESGQAASAGLFEQYKHKTYSLVALQKAGNWNFAAAYARADKGTCSRTGGTDCVTDGLDGNQISLGTKYDFSKRVSTFLIAARISNGMSAQYNFLSSAIGPGSDPKALAAGVVVNF